MILSDREIVEMLARKIISIEPFDRESITPNGYDLKIGEIFIPNTNIKINKDSVNIPKKTHFLISTKEYIKIGHIITAQLWLRTTYARKGIISSFGKVDAGFEGTLTLSGLNASENEIELKIDDRFVQIVFEYLSREVEVPYQIRSGHYMFQRGL